MRNDVPLFPLNSVICPGGRLPLQLFEPRYLQMLAECMKNGGGFVIVLIKEGEEAGVSTFYQVGTLVNIVDFQQLENGLLGITAEGADKVLISKAYRDASGLYRGSIETIDSEAHVDLPERHDELVGILQALVKHPAINELKMTIDYSDGREVGWRLTELLPIATSEKQYLLELSDPMHRLDRISDFISHYDH